MMETESPAPVVRVCIEVTAGSRQRHRYHETSLAFIGVRQAPQPYPYPYGFVLGTMTADGESVDCYLITHERLEPGVVLECDPVGLLEQVENGEIDHKVLAVMPGQEISLDQALLEELRDFIHASFAAEPSARVQVGRMQPREAAIRHLQACRV